MQKHEIETAIVNLQDEIDHLEQEKINIQADLDERCDDLDSFEYTCTEDQFEEFLNDRYGTVDVCGFEHWQGTLLKEINPIVFRCAKSDHEANFDLDDCEEYQELQGSIEELENELAKVEEEIENLREELDNLCEQLSELGE